MKNCANCGTQAEDNMVFCENCGTRFEVQSGTNNVAAQQQHQQQWQASPRPPRAPLSANPVVNLLKTQASSTLFLVTVLIFTAMLLFSLISAFQPNPLATKLLDSNELVHSAFGGIAESINGMASTGALIGLIPTILICIGLWLFYASSGRLEDRSTSGLTMIKVLSVLALVGLLIIPVLLLVFLLITIFHETSTSGIGDGVSATMAIILFAVACISLVLPVVYQINVIKTINNVKNTLLTGTPTRLSGFVIVMNYICAGITFISLFSSRGIGVLASLLNIAFLILISVGMSKYNNLLLQNLYAENNTNSVLQ